MSLMTMCVCCLYIHCIPIHIDFSRASVWCQITWSRAALYTFYMWLLLVFFFLYQRIELIRPFFSSLSFQRSCYAALTTYFFYFSLLLFPISSFPSIFSKFFFFLVLQMDFVNNIFFFFCWQCSSDAHTKASSIF